ncbi:STAS domain-containing protein [Candidatus Uabimicrobium sp. HlEnr_7]|uniref:STAS domain-containing protein n=1 Tax=Candidatus Uabimicrobium helgolandensis TaxID=3095367 RepID=UPI00355772CB
MKINTKDMKNNIKLVTFEGQINESTINLIQGTFSSIFNLNQNKIVCDMQKVEHISAPVLMNFLENITEARNRGGGVKLLNVQAALQGIFRYAGFNDDTVFCDNLKTATQHLENIVATQYDDNVEDPFGSTIQTTNLGNFTPISPLSAPASAAPSAPTNVEDPFGSTIQTSNLSGFKSVAPVTPVSPISPLSPPKQSSSPSPKVEDPFAATIQTNATSNFTPVSPVSPVTPVSPFSPKPKPNQKKEEPNDPFGATIQAPNFMPKKDTE